MKLLFFFLAALVITLAACTSSKENTDTEIRKYVSEKIPPGTAVVESEIKSIEENSSSYILNVQIGKVKGYGPSIKPIAAQTIMKINLAKTLITSGIEKDYLKIGGVYEFEISQPPKTMNDTANSIWQASTIKKVR